MLALGPANLFADEPIVSVGRNDASCTMRWLLELRNLMKSPEEMTNISSFYRGLASISAALS